MSQLSLPMRPMKRPAESSPDREASENIEPERKKNRVERAIDVETLLRQIPGFLFDENHALIDGNRGRCVEPMLQFLYAARSAWCPSPSVETVVKRLITIFGAATRLTCDSVIADLYDPVLAPYTIEAFWKDVEGILRSWDNDLHQDGPRPVIDKKLAVRALRPLVYRFVNARNAFKNSGNQVPTAEGYVKRLHSAVAKFSGAVHGGLYPMVPRKPDIPRPSDPVDTTELEAYIGGLGEDDKAGIRELYANKERINRGLHHATHKKEREWDLERQEYEEEYEELKRSNRLLTNDLEELQAENAKLEAEVQAMARELINLDGEIEEWKAAYAEKDVDDQQEGKNNDNDRGADSYMYEVDEDLMDLAG